jgi:hypothetical protein
MANSITEATPAGRALRREVSLGERQRFVRAHVSPEMERFLAGQQPERPSWNGPLNGEGMTMQEDHTGAAARADSPQPAPNKANMRGQSPHPETGIQRLLDAWGQATLAERNTFLWLAAEEIQAAQEGEHQNALTTPQARGNSPSVRSWERGPGRERAHGGLSSADLAAAEEEADAWLDEEAEQARLWRDDATAAQSQGIPRPLERVKRSFAPQPGEEEGPSAASAGEQGSSEPRV